MMNILEFAAICANAGRHPDIDMNCLHELPCYFYMKDRRGNYIGVNDYLVKDVGLNSTDDLLGLSDFDLCQEKTATALRDNDDRIKAVEATEIFVEPITFLNGRQATSISYKAPLRSRNKKNIGVIGLSIVHYPSPGPGQALDKIAQTVPFSIDGCAVTDKESKVLYWLARGKTAREIAVILKRSQRTIEHHIENIKHKTGAANKSELIEKYYAARIKNKNDN